MRLDGASKNANIAPLLCSFMTTREDARHSLSEAFSARILPRVVTGGLAQVPAAQAPSGFSFSPVGLWSAACATSHRSVPLDKVPQRPQRPHIGAMQHLDLSDNEAAALTRELLNIIVENYRYPLSPRVQMLRDILAKLSAEPVGEQQPPPKVYEPPRATGARRRRRG